MIDPQNDPQGVDELVNAALSESDEDVAWNAVCALHWRGTAEVLTRAAALSKSNCTTERRLGANILGQLGVPDRTFPKESLALLRDMLQHEQEADGLQAIFVACSHLDDPSIASVAAEYALHPDSDVRHAVVLALSGYEDQSAINALILLSGDDEPDVRDWATFGLGTQLKLNTAQVRDALAERLADPDEETRGEAMIGLARRKDGRVIGAIQNELSSQSTAVKALEAAELIGAPELLPQLMALRGVRNDYPDFLEGVIAACTPS